MTPTKARGLALLALALSLLLLIPLILSFGDKHPMSKIVFGTQEIMPPTNPSRGDAPVGEIFVIQSQNRVYHTFLSHWNSKASGCILGSLDGKNWQTVQLFNLNGMDGEGELIISTAFESTVPWRYVRVIVYNVEGADGVDSDGNVVAAAVSVWVGV